MTHVQCTLNRDNSYFVSWLPKKYAKKNKILDFDIEGEGWKVITVGGKQADSKYILNRKHNIFGSIK